MHQISRIGVLSKEAIDPLPPTLRNPSDCSVLTHSLNKRVSGSGFQPSPKSPSATSDTRQPLYEMPARRNIIGG